MADVSSGCAVDDGYDAAGTGLAAVPEKDVTVA
jgi:hypothetical protein